MRRFVTILAIGLACTLSLSGLAHAAIIITFAEGGLDSFAAAGNDLINQGTPTFSSQSNVGGSNYGSNADGTGLNNGTIYAGSTYGDTTGDKTYSPQNGSSITFDLDLATQPAGYTIGSIRSVSGGSQNRRSQRFRLEVSAVGNPAFTTLADENQIHFVSNALNGEMRVVVQDNTGAPLATGVDQVRVTYFDTGATLPQSMYRELDVIAPAAPLAHTLPQVTSANLSAHFDASDVNNDGGATNPGDGNNLNSWTDLVSGAVIALAPNGPQWLAAGSGGIDNKPTARFDSSNTELLFNNSMSFNAQTIYAVATMVDNGASLATMMSDKNHDFSIRQTTAVSPTYFTGNVDDFIAGNGVFHINGNPRFDIPGGFGAQHVVKAVRNAAANYDGFHLSDDIAADRFWNGDIAEVIIYDGALNGNDAARMNKYLNDKYGASSIPPQVIDEPISTTTQVADDPFGIPSGLTVAHIGVNFYYAPGGTTSGTLHGIPFNNIDLSGGSPPSGPFTLDGLGTGGTLTLNFPFTSDNTLRNQNTNAIGPDAATLNTVANEMFYLGGNNHPSATMTFSDLVPDKEFYIQVLGGDAGWTGDLLVEANGSSVATWMTVANGSSNVGSLLGFFARSDLGGMLQLDFSIDPQTGNYAAIGGIILSEVIPEPATLSLLGLGALGLWRRRRRSR